uniref:Uncharacterized protein n=1 Tax=Pipistrellus kuhlii TaxID=59472 RepID=A0A7J7WLG9_PIPKU|nr:hypothetical protein mPipKuh1_007939 [Pipistrellus kuhlii]
MRVLQCSLLAPLRERCPRFSPAAKQSMLSPNEPGTGVQFSWKWSWRWRSEQSGAPVSFPSGQSRGTADRPFSVRSVRAAAGTSFHCSPGFCLTARLPMAEPESPGSGLKLGIRAVGGPAQSEFYLLSARERPPGTRPPSSPALSSLRAASPRLRTLAFPAPPRLLLVFSLLLAVEFPVSQPSCSSGQCPFYILVVFY